MRLQFVRDATLIVEVAGRRMLVDPRLGASDLPEPAEVVVHGIDALLVTALDRLDAEALRLLPRDVPVACHARDADALQRHGFRAVGAAPDVIPTEHGFVVAAPGEPVVYLAGEIGWSGELREALERHRPAVVVVKAESAVEVARHAPDARVVAVLDAHATGLRADLHQRLHDEGLVEQVSVPEDGSEIPVD